MALAILLCSLIFGHYYAIWRAQRRLARAYNAVRQDGLPVTVAQFQKLTVIPNEAQNAAPIYQQLTTQYFMTGWHSLDNNLEPTVYHLLNIPYHDAVSTPKMNSAQLVRAENQYVNLVASFMPWLSQALKRPYCNFHRDWSLGPMVLLPEYATLAALTRQLALRAVFLDRQGKPLEALHQIEIGQKLAKDIGSEPIVLALLVQGHCERVLNNAWLLIVEHHSHDPDFLKQAQRVSRGFSSSVNILPHLSGESLGTILTFNLLRTGGRPMLEKLKTGTSTSPIEDQDLGTRLWYVLSGNQRRNQFPLTLVDNTEAQELWHLHDMATIAKRYANEPAKALKAYLQLHYTVPRWLNVEDNGFERQIFEQTLLMQTCAHQRQLVLDLFKYRLQHHQFPKDLSAFPTEETLDPFNNRPMRYRRTAQGFVLTSVGERALAYSPWSDSEITVRFPPQP
ncbi:MAG TPA: hypothetical protein VKV18_00010 [Chthonomonas sp.]|uniref:hypothetical protein n=1 Tax=Chthonomonas sp. TaxID=2282153 RepID=UPI002B4B77D5|nr:hypothetical protein [Chthonomonas sp.]HLI47064.1 hypothetical protein [Chthonomonas sp.]